MLRNQCITVLKVFLFWFFVIQGVYSSVAVQKIDSLATVKKIKCSFPVIASAQWVSGEPEASIARSTLLVEFEEINTDEATAEIVGRFGPSHIITQLSESEDYLHFIQMFRGPLYTTTVINRETRDGKLMAVHTRHEHTDVALAGFTSSPEQYYGECEVEW